MKNFIQPGDTVTAVAPYDVASGGGALIGLLFGVAVTALANGASGEFKTRGIVRLPKSAGVALTAWGAAYWDNAAKAVTSVAAGNTKIGVSQFAQANGDTSATVRLNGVF